MTKCSKNVIFGSVCEADKKAESHKNCSGAAGPTSPVFTEEKQDDCGPRVMRLCMSEKIPVAKT